MTAQPLHPFGGAAAWTGPGGFPRLAASAQRLPATLELLRQVVPSLRQRGYRFVTLDRLLNA